MARCMRLAAGGAQAGSLGVSTELSAARVGAGATRAAGAKAGCDEADGTGDGDTTGGAASARSCVRRTTLAPTVVFSFAIACIRAKACARAAAESTLPLEKLP